MDQIYNNNLGIFQKGPMNTGNNYTINRAYDISLINKVTGNKLTGKSLRGRPPSVEMVQ